MPYQKLHVVVTEAVAAVLVGVNTRSSFYTQLSPFPQMHKNTYGDAIHRKNTSLMKTFLAVAETALYKNCHVLIIGRRL